jgi:hypothetical protein
MVMRDNLLAEFRDYADSVDKILSPVAVMDRFCKLAENNPLIKVEGWGKDKSGREILSYCLGKGEFTILMYGFPDPGEAVGGTSLLAFTELFLNSQSLFSSLPLKIVVVPCLNFVDQPNDGVENVKVQKTAAQEVDWCVHAPRPETKAILDIAAAYRPALTYPLHDEWHGAEYVPPYVGVDPLIDAGLVNFIADFFGTMGMSMNQEYSHKDMGTGIFLMPEIGEEYKNCTYSHFAKYGQVFICEVPYHKDLSPSQLVYIQCAIGVAFILKNGTRF